MDTGKLLKIITDIEDEEVAGKIQTRLRNIANYLVQDDPTSVNTERDSIREYVTGSRLSEYATSDFHALEQLDAVHLFGPGLYQSLESVLNSQTHEVRKKLEELITDREQKVAALIQAGKSLALLDFQSHTLGEGEYEIGFVLPEGYAEMIKTEQAIHDLRIFLDALASAKGNQQTPRIKYVSNGTIELFIEAGLEIVENFVFVVETLLTIYGAMQAFRDGARRYENFSSKRKKKIEALDEEEKQEQVRGLVDKLMDKLDIEDIDGNNRVKLLFLKVLKHVENGVGLEVRTPDTQEPPEPPADSTDEDQAVYQQSLAQYETKKSIDANNRDIFILQKNNFYGMDTKFLQPPDNIDEKE